MRTASKSCFEVWLSRHQNIASWWCALVMMLFPQLFQTFAVLASMRSVILMVLTCIVCISGPMDREGCSQTCAVPYNNVPVMHVDMRILGAL